MEHTPFSEIIRLSSQVTITEKIHGTNAQIYIFEYAATDGESHEPRIGIKAGSRTRWITPQDDNYGFAAWVEANKDALIASLGLGTHYGEWFGSGINSGYGLQEKRLALFDVRFADKTLPDRVTTVPILYRGPWRENVVSETLTKLQSEGSKVCPGFMHPEGIVICFERNGATFKQVFVAEETGWKQGEPKAPRCESDSPEVLALLQPIRLEKLLSQEERYLREYPVSLPKLASAYVGDLEKEGQLDHVSKEVMKAVGKRVFTWIKDQVRERGYGL